MGDGSTLSVGLGDGSKASVGSCDGSTGSVGLADGSMAPVGLYDGSTGSVRLVDGSKAPFGSCDGFTCSVGLIDGSKAPVELLDSATSSLCPLDGATESVGVVDGSSGLVDNINASVGCLDGALRSVGLVDGASVGFVDGALRSGGLSDGRSESSNIRLKVLETTHIYPATVSSMGGHSVTGKAQVLASTDDQHNLTAVKNDLAAVPVGFWNERVSAYPGGKILPRGEIDLEFEFICNWLCYKMLCRWRKNIERSFWKYLYSLKPMYYRNKWMSSIKVCVGRSNCEYV